MKRLRLEFSTSLHAHVRNLCEDDASKPSPESFPVSTPASLDAFWLRNIMRAFLLLHVAACCHVEMPLVSDYIRHQKRAHRAQTGLAAKLLTGHDTELSAYFDTGSVRFKPLICALP